MIFFMENFVGADVDIIEKKKWMILTQILQVSTTMDNGLHFYKL